TAGRAALLVSGGIDSPVAGWMMSKRGVSLTAIHFASPPYTSQRAEQKVMELLQKVAEYSGRISTFVVPFTEIQEQIKDNCPEELFTIIMRRFMMRISEIIAKQDNCGALITGESLGQVASQTLYAIGCTDAVCTLPTFRPLIGMDKDEIVAISRKIDTFNISIQPFEDCCTVFTPKHPRTRPTLEYVEQAEDKLDIDGLVKRAVEATRNETVG
ncbi:MAG: tRNA 4-thiouridine(8) synthase ThiI, partial [Oscillospiraceae bacterium]